MNGSSATRRNTEERLTVLLGSVGATGVCVGGETDCQKRFLLQKVPQHALGKKSKSSNACCGQTGLKTEDFHRLGIFLLLQVTSVSVMAPVP